MQKCLYPGQAYGKLPINVLIHFELVKNEGLL